MKGLVRTQQLFTISTWSSFALQLLKYLDIIPREDAFDELDPEERSGVRMIPSSRRPDDLPPVPPLFVILLENRDHISLLE